MVEAQAQKEKTIFREFLKNLFWFLDDNDLTHSESVVLIYVQEPYESLEGFASRGVVKIGGKTFTFVATLNMQFGTIEIDSKAFHFFLKIDEVEEYLRTRVGVTFE
jgi:hypothetical protein